MTNMKATPPTRSFQQDAPQQQPPLSLLSSTSILMEALRMEDMLLSSSQEDGNLGGSATPCTTDDLLQLLDEVIAIADDNEEYLAFASWRSNTFPVRGGTKKSHRTNKQ